MNNFLIGIKLSQSVGDFCFSVPCFCHVDQFIDFHISLKSLKFTNFIILSLVVMTE